VDFTLLTLDLLKFLKDIGGSYGMAIIILTILVRIILTPLSVSQQRSMKKMQELSPKLKQIQLNYKNDPQKLQQKMMEFYKENSFNPLGGCLPLLLQMPVFIALYTALISVPFLQMAGNSSFLFIHRLDSTLQSYAGTPRDNTFCVKEKDVFITGQYNIKVTVNGKEYDAQIPDYRNAVKLPERIVNGKAELAPIIPGNPLKISIKPEKIVFTDPTVDKTKIQSATIPIVDDNSKEIEILNFNYDNNTKMLETTVKTAQGKTNFNYDVLILLLLFGITMYGSQKIMTGMSSTAEVDPQQKAMQESMGKIMPFMIMAMFIIIPIPSGVLLYMVVSNIFQVGQTYAINKYLDYEDSKPKLPKKDSPSDTSNKIGEADVIDVEATVKSPVSGPGLSGMSRKERKLKNKNKKQ